MTIAEPSSCVGPNRSPKNITANKMVETGPIVPTIELLLAPMIFIPSTIKNEGITVAITAIDKAYKYTSVWKVNKLKPLIIALWSKIAKHATIIAVALYIRLLSCVMMLWLPTK